MGRVRDVDLWDAVESHLRAGWEPKQIADATGRNVNTIGSILRQLRAADPTLPPARHYHKEARQSPLGR
jgi:hypothetical protein